MISAADPIPFTGFSSPVIAPSVPKAPELQAKEEEEQWEQTFIDKVKKYLDRMQDAADDLAPPSDPIELSRLLSEYETLRGRVLRLKMGCCGIKAYKIATYAAYTATVLSGIALIGTAIAGYFYENEEDFECAQNLLYPCVTVGTQVATFCKYKWIAAKKEPINLDCNVQEQLEEADRFQHLVTLITSFHSKIHEKNSTEALVKIIKIFIENFAPLDNYEYDVEKIISSFLIMIPRDHPLRQAFESDRMNIAPLPRLGDSSYNSRERDCSRGSIESPPMRRSTIEESEFKRSPESAEAPIHRSNSYQYPYAAPSKLQRVTSQYIQRGEGAIQPEQASLSAGNSPSLLSRSSIQRHQLSKLGLPMKTIWANNQQIPLL